MSARERALAKSSSPADRWTAASMATWRWAKRRHPETITVDPDGVTTCTHPLYTAVSDGHADALRSTHSAEGEDR